MIASTGILFNLIAICKYYLGRNKESNSTTTSTDIKIVQISGMLAAIFWSISLACFLLNWYASCIIGDRSDGYLFAVSDNFATICLVWGCTCFYVSFRFRIIGSFKDSMLAVSSKLIKVFYTFIILSICFNVFIVIVSFWLDHNFTKFIYLRCFS